MTRGRRRARSTGSRRLARLRSTRSGSRVPEGPVLTPRFGTDGVRGVANADLSPEVVLALGRAAARVLVVGGSGPGEVIVARDTRRSGPMLAAALCSGLAAEGVTVLDLGVAPTPAAAWLASARGCAAAVVSASHNPFADNGVKLFAKGGSKLSDGQEAAVEAELERLGAAEHVPGRVLTGERVGWVQPHPVDGYMEALLAAAPSVARSPLQVVVDCANGAASAVAPEVFRRIGARVSAIHHSPDGVNINSGCGSTDPADLRRTVLDARADAGFAFDGDADRVVAVDAAGELVDGDQMIALLAVDRRARAALPGDTVVVTVMANLGFREAMAAQGIRVEETPVGDRHVLERLAEGGWVLGGEQSGHVIFRDLATTGDGLLTALSVLEVMASTGRSLADLAAVMTRRPQTLRSVRVASSADLGTADGLWAAVKAVEARLDGRGRVLVRPSGTEPVVRVMVEAHSEEEAALACTELCEAVVRAAGAAEPPAAVEAAGAAEPPAAVEAAGAAEPPAAAEAAGAGG